MQKTKSLIISILLLTLILGGCGSSIDEILQNESYQLTVRTTDGNKTISDVQISISGNEISSSLKGETDIDGLLLLTDLKGTVDIEAVHGDYDFSAIQVTKSNANQTIDIIGQEITYHGDYNLTFQVNAVTEGQPPVANALVTVNERTGNTDVNGTRIFAGFDSGNYDYTVSATGYTQVSGTVEILSIDKTVQINMAPIPEEGNRIHFSGILFYDVIQNSWTEIPYLANGHYNEYGLNTDDFVGSGDYHSNSLAFPNAVATTFDGIAIDEGTRLIIYSQENFQGEIIIDVYGPKLINNYLYEGSFQVSDYLTKTFSPPELNEQFPPETRSWSDSNMHNWSYGSLRIRTSSDPDYHDDFPPLVSTSEQTATIVSDSVQENPAGF